MLKISEKNIAGILLAVLLVFFTVIALLSEGVHGGADNYVHYRIAKYAFRHPEFFLDHWGKPLFTTLGSIFAQYGFYGLKIFNVITGLLSAYFTFRIAQKLRYRFPLLAIIMLCAMPMYFMLMISTLTEIIFSFCLILSVFLFLEKKYRWYAVVASFLPFARTEGFFLLPFLALPLVYEKKFRVIPLLFSATLFYSVVGSFHYHDFLWVFSEIPYIGGKNIYGKGDLLHFVLASKEITGLLPAFLLVIGIAALVYARVKKEKEGNNPVEWMLIFTPFFIYLSLHSFLWWQGLGSSAGLTRVIAGVLPLGALLCLRGWNFIYGFLPQKKIISISAFALLLFFLIREPFIRNRIPHPLPEGEALIKETSEWLRHSEHFHKKIYYYDPTFCFFLDINPYDESRIRERVPDHEQPEKEIAPGEIVLWDAHFAPQEGHLSLERMTNNPHYTMIKKFEPDESFRVSQGNGYAIYVFRRKEE